MVRSTGLFCGSDQPSCVVLVERRQGLGCFAAQIWDLSDAGDDGKLDLGWRPSERKNTRLPTTLKRDGNLFKVRRLQSIL